MISNQRLSRTPIRAKHRHPHLLLRDRRIRRRVKQESGLMVMGASQRKLAVVWGNQ